ncbi:glycine oxidase ThiO [Paenibacillus radicis (ex Xue et al. 2023)]|uniref:glycine oxidase n=1 Tax=Paenibacillus radicis (ex Xue et al. 2023) TaxID=2972489 RepID=A0ABT1YCV4_9BACL|nr:glycine oxidase ThiO [Paenibacillus radicis (ex Xue et al. 2023)]MCR8631027.1 glycine oxidase ThiO [Paenibacillus radicis (ex Xue et al. 2023)]
MNSSNRTALIIGGGIIGCSIAFELLRAGIKCTLIDKGALNKEASTAAAGMLGAQVEIHHPGAFYDLCKWSQQLYRNWTEDLLETGGISPQYIDKGILRAALTEEDELELLSRLPWIHNAEWLTAKEMRAIEPCLSHEIRGGLSFQQDHQVHPVHLALALQASIHKLGCDIREWTPAFGLIERNGRIQGVRTAEGELLADQVIIASGAWSSALTEPFGLKLSLFPVKGQCISLRTAAPVISSTVFTKGCYIVPKQDGSMIIGATQEECGYDKRCQASVIGTLHTAATKLLPELEQAEFVSTWAGLRPGTPDDLPYIGRFETIPGLIMAAGHYRNGILLAPATGLLIKQLVMEEPTGINLTPFTPDRVLTPLQQIN